MLMVSSGCKGITSWEELLGKLMVGNVLAQLYIKRAASFLYFKFWLEDKRILIFLGVIDFLTFLWSMMN